MQCDYNKWNISVVIYDTDIPRYDNQVMVVTEKSYYFWNYLEKGLVFLEKLPHEICLIRIKNQVSDKRCTVSTHGNANYLWKNIPTKQQICFQSRTRPFWWCQFQRTFCC